MTKTVASIETAVDRRAAQTARMVALDKKLDSLHARLLTGGKAPDGGLQNWYTLNGQTVIVHEYPDNNGYEVYTPIVDTIAVDATFAALDRIANPQPRHCLNCDKTATAFCNAYHTTSTVNPAKPQATGSNQSKYDRENSTVQLPTAADRGAARGAIAEMLQRQDDVEGVPV